MEASLRFGGAETCDSKIFGRLSAWQNWIFTRPNAVGEAGALVRYGQPEAADFRLEEDVSNVDLEAKIPNNVGLRDNKRLCAPSESWQPALHRVVEGDGPDGLQRGQVYLRTAVGVGKGGWAHFDSRQDARLPLGHLPGRGRPDRKIHFGDHIGKPVWNEVPGEMRNRCAA
jgi:hypothetical protein